MLPKLSYEVRFLITLLIILLAFLLLAVAFDKFSGVTDSVLPGNKQQKEKTIIVSDAEKSALLSSAPKKIAASMREAAKQDNMSTAYLQLNRTAPGSKEHDELKHLIESDAKLKKRPGVTKVKDTPNAPLRYMDKTSPKDRSVDSLYLYLVDIGGGVWPRFCVQSVGKVLLRPHEFRIRANSKTFQFKGLVFKAEKVANGVSEYYDEPYNAQIFAAMQTLVKVRKGTISIIGAKDTRTRNITEDEIKSMDRMMDTYLALGGSLDLYKGTGGAR